MTEQITVKFYDSKLEHEVYIPVLAKKLELSEQEIQNFFRISWNEPELTLTETNSEADRIKLTKFQITGIPKSKFSKKYKKLNNLVNQELWLYWNGSEKSWELADGEGFVTDNYKYIQVN